MSDTYVHDFSYQLGSQIFSLEESSKEKRIFSDPSEYRKAGFERHHVSPPQESPYDLAKKAVSKIKAPLEDVTDIIYATCLTLNGNLGQYSMFLDTKDVKHLMNYPASHLQADFNMTQAAVIGINQQACTSMLGALRLAKALLQQEPEQKKILCVTADRFPEGASYEQAYNVISDGASACVVSREPKGYKIVQSHAITNGALVQANDDETVGSYFSYTHRIISEILQKAKMDVNQIDWVVPQNTNVNAWLILSRLLGIDISKVYFNSIKEVGHIISSDNVVNLVRLENEGKIKSRDRILLFMAGYGLNWQATILEKV